MNIWEKIKALWAVKGTGEVIFKEATMPTASGKPGWKTTEFWMNAGTQVGVLWAAIHGFVPAPWNVIVPVVGSSIYAICATVRKAVADVQAAKAAAGPAVAAGESATATATVSTK